MNKFVRLLIMFGPMIYRGVTKMLNQRNRQNHIPPMTPPNRQEPLDDKHHDAPQEMEGTYDEDDLVEEQ